MSTRKGVWSGVHVWKQMTGCHVGFFFKRGYYLISNVTKSRSFTWAEDWRVHPTSTGSYSTVQSVLARNTDSIHTGSTHALQGQLAWNTTENKYQKQTSRWYPWEKTSILEWNMFTNVKLYIYVEVPDNCLCQISHTKVQSALVCAKSPSHEPSV